LTVKSLFFLAVAIYRFHFSFSPLIAARTEEPFYQATEERIRHRKLMDIYKQH